MKLSLSGKSLAVAVAGSLIVATLAWACLTKPFAEGLARLSYDLPFALRGNLATPEICLVTLDEKSARALQQPVDAPWDRRLHAELVRRLSAAGARAVLFDIVFDAPSSDPAVDAEFSAALKESGKVFLGGALRTVPGRDVAEEQILAPTPVLRRAAAGWGLLAVKPIDEDFAVRRIFPGNEQVPSAAWRVAHRLGAALPATPETPAPEQWLNFYAPAGRLARASYPQALSDGELAPDFFRDRIVIVGGMTELGNLGQSKDTFPTPYTRWGEHFASGMELHATAILNLLRHEWLTRAPRHREVPLVLIFAVLVTGLFSWQRPLGAMTFALGAALAIAGGACWSVWHRHEWWNWLVPVGVVLPTALVWSLTAHYLMEARRRAQIRRAFAHYLSPHMADQIAKQEFDLKPGGHLVEATMLFSDLKGFSSLSEELADPKRISEVLIAYFNIMSGHVLQTGGTVIKYIGDAVFAAWGVPMADPDHAGRAVAAALEMMASSRMDVDGRQLVTRIGVNTGTTLAGNLGSDFRFDYTLIGDAVNLAARLEGMNKYLGTSVLLSETTWRKVEGRFAARCLGSFRVVGKKGAVEVYELLGPAGTSAEEAVMATFAKGLDAYRRGDLATARELFENARSERGWNDGPSDFYLARIDHWERVGKPEPWDAIINLDEK